MGERHHGAIDLDAGQGPGTDPREAPAVFRDRHARRPTGRADGPVPVPCSPAWKRSVALRDGGHLSGRRSLTRDADQHRDEKPIACQSVGHGADVPAVLPALRVHVRHRQHAAGDPIRDLSDSSEVLCRAAERHLPERDWAGHSDIGSGPADGLRRRDGAVCQREVQEEAGVIMWERIKHMLIKEFIQIFRDPRMKGVIFLMPIIQLLVFGYAVTTDVKNVATLVHDLDNSIASRELVSRFVKSGYFNVVEYTDSEDRVRKLMDRGKVGAVLRMSKGFEDDLRAGRTSQLQVIVDGTDSNTAGIVLGYSSKIAGQVSTELLTQRILRSSGPVGQTGRVVVETRAWFNENLESRNFYVPGVIAIIVMLITLMLTSMAVVREKEIGTMEQIMVTPITSAEFILGKTVPFALIGFADVILITLIGVFWFEVPIRGNLALLFVATALYLLTTLSIGLFISTVSQTQQQAMMSTFFFYLPAVLLSGFMFPIANMPPLVQWLTYLNPLRYFLVIIRGIFLKGVGPSVLWPQLLALAVMGFLTLWLAAKRFHKTLA